MSFLRRLSYLALTLMLLAQPVRATWSILIIDVTTGEVAVGIATCLTGFDLKPNTVVVVPGRGVAAAQSFVGPLSLRELMRSGILNGSSAQQILQQLAAADSGHQTRQYGIASLVGGEITFTGTGAGAWAGGLTGQIGNLRYTVQGNVLTGAPVVTAAEQAILNTPGSIGEKLMVAMEAAARMGGDGRCSCSNNNPTACGAPPASFTKSAHIGLMIVSRPSDLDLPCTPALGCGAGVYWMDLNVANQNANAPDAVVQLRQRYDTWRAQQVGRADHFQSTVTLDRSRIRANGFDTVTGTVTLRDASGALLGNSLPVTVGLSNRSTVPSATFSAVTPQPNGTYTFTLRGNLDPGTAIVDVAVNDAFGRVGIWPQPSVTIDDLFGPCGVGAIPDGRGGVLPALRVNGSSGVNRRTSVGYAQPFTLSLEAPAGVPPTPPAGLFLLWAHLGVPQPSAELPLGPSLGSLCFTPSPFAIAPTVLIADSFGIGGYAGWGPAPFSVQIPGIPALIDLTLQGAMAIDPLAQFAATNALHLTVTPLPPPVVSTITPTAPTPGQTVTITGSSFQVGLEVAIDNVPVTLLTRTPTSATFAMPAGVRCDAQISVRNPGSASVVRTLNATPIVSSMPSTSGPASGGVFFFLAGQNLDSATVSFNGVPMTITSRTATSIFGQTPPGTPGPAVIVIRNPNGCQTTRNYTYL
jgi:uncharacterized Ntn-hydrolase superfamily protein